MDVNTTEYSIWLTNPDFAIATAALLVLTGLIIFSGLIRYIVTTNTSQHSTIAKKVDDISNTLGEQVATVKTLTSILDKIISKSYTGEKGDDSK